MNYSMLQSLLLLCLCMTSSAAPASRPLRYVALGDSYTAGTGASGEESWPAVVTARLQKKGVAIELAANLGHNGWTTQDLIDYELPTLRKLAPDFVTLLIGTNDWIQNVNAKTFQQHLEYILDELVKIVPDPKHILLVTMPDFSVTPSGGQFAFGRDISQGLKEYNRIILQEAQKRGAVTVDLFPFSKMMDRDPSLTSADGLHPSAKGYAAWADLIEPVIQTLS